MQNIQFKINSFNEYLEAKYQKENLIKNINKEFIKQSNIATISICQDIINNVIIEKLNKLIEQAKNPDVIHLIGFRDDLLNNLNESLEILNNEKESILAIVTSNLKQKKRVTKLAIAKSDALTESKYIAYLVANGSSEYQEILTNEDDINLAIRFIEINEQLNSINTRIYEINQDFQKDLKNLNIDYIENDFSLEFEILEQNSKFNNLNSILDLDPELNYLLYGTNNDYETYKNSLFKIQELYKQLNELTKTK